MSRRQGIQAQSIDMNAYMIIEIYALIYFCNICLHYRIWLNYAIADVVLLRLSPVEINYSLW